MVMNVVLVNEFHAGDVLLSRALIHRIRPLLIDVVKLELHCNGKYSYLWRDLGLPFLTRPLDTPGINPVNMWFGFQKDLLGVSGLTHATQVVSYNRQAKELGLPLLDENEPVPEVNLPVVPVSESTGVLVENGPVLSGQKTIDLNPWLPRIAKKFPNVPFYCASKPPRGASNLVDVSSRSLIQLASLSRVCKAMIARLSGVFVSTLMQHNRGRLPRLVIGEPIGCPIWDETDVRYLDSPEALEANLRGILR